MAYKGPRWYEDNKVDVTAYFKPTNKLLYLPYSSSHPAHMKHGVAKGESIRLLRNNCHKDQWIKQCMFVFKGFMARGYPPNKIKSAWKSIRFDDRQKYIWEDSIKSKPPGQVIITRYHPLTNYFWNNIITQHPFIDIFNKGRLGIFNKKQIKLIRNCPPTIIYGDFKRIGQQVISAKQSWSYKPLERKRRYSDFIVSKPSNNKRRRI